MGHHLIPIKMETIKKLVDEDVEKLECWWEGKMVQLLWKTVGQFLKKLKIELPCDPAILLLGIYTEELKAGSQRDTCIPMFIAALFIYC